jgi:hypothetical protein
MHSKNYFMDTLLILLVFQFAGAALCTIFSYLDDVRESKTIYVSNRVLRSKDVPPWPWLEEHFLLNQQSGLRKLFPDSYKVAMATKRYIELNGSVRPSSKRYQKKLKRILKLVDINRQIGIEEEQAHQVDY